MTQLFRRQVVAYVEGAAVEHLHMVFKAERNIKKDPNSLELGIYNLAPSTLARMQVPRPLVELAAGYAGRVQKLFHGEAYSVLPSSDGKDTITKVMCGDGRTAYSFGRVNQAFAPGTPVLSVVKGVAAQMKVGIGNAVQAFQKGGAQGAFQAFTNGLTASGSASEVLDNVIRTAGFTWSIQDGELQILTSDTDTAGTVDVIAPDTGLVGDPELGSRVSKHKPARVKVKALLRPTIRPGVAFQVESRTVKGQFRAEKVSHEGDSWGGDWFTTIEAAPL